MLGRKLHLLLCATLASAFTAATCTPEMCAIGTHRPDQSTPPSRTTTSSRTRRSTITRPRRKHPASSAELHAAAPTASRPAARPSVCGGPTTNGPHLRLQLQPGGSRVAHLPQRAHAHGHAYTPKGIKTVVSEQCSSVRSSCSSSSPRSRRDDSAARQRLRHQLPDLSVMSAVASPPSR